MKRLVTVFPLLAIPALLLAQSLEEDIARLAEKVKPSIVTVKSEGGNWTRVSDQLKVTPFSSTLAAGIAIDKEHVVTTASVEQVRFLNLLGPSDDVKQALELSRNGESKFTVVTADGKELKAALWASDRTANLAVLKVEGELIPANLGNSDQVKSGSWVMLPASALSKTASVSFGPVAELRQDGLLLLDLASTPGAIGGPVVNSKGEVVGMVTGQSGEKMSVRSFRFEKEEGIQRVVQPGDVALPVSGRTVAMSSNQMQKLAAELIQNKRIVRAFLGVYPQNLDNDLKEYHKTEHGVLISSLAGGGPAEKAGLKQGDVVLSMDGEKMEDEQQFRRFLNGKKPGDAVKIRILRSGRERSYTVVLGDRSDFESVLQPNAPGRPQWREPLRVERRGAFLGVTATDLTDAQKKRFDLEDGAYVDLVAEGSPAEKAGLKEGDVITAFDGRPVENAAELYERIREAEPGKEALVEVLRKGGLETVTVTLGERSEEDVFGAVPRIREPLQMFRWNAESTAFLGVTTERLSRRAKDRLKIEAGVRVAEVSEGSPAEKAGLKEGDVITAIGDADVSTPEALSEIIGTKKPGEKIEVQYLRRGRTRTATAELAGRSGHERLFGGMPRIDFRPSLTPGGRDKQIDEMQKQIEQLRRALDSLRRGDE
jgi:serine protease Do